MQRADAKASRQEDEMAINMEQPIRGDRRMTASSSDSKQDEDGMAVKEADADAPAATSHGSKRRSGAPKRVVPFRHGGFAPADDGAMDEFMGRRGCMDRLRDWAGRIGHGETKGSKDERRAAEEAAAASGAGAVSGGPAAAAEPASHAHSKPSVQQVRVAEYQRLRFGSNRICSARYTPLNFLPLNLFEQMAPWKKPANFYFLCIAILQSIKSISTTNGRPSILVPLVFVLAVTAIKDALEDYHRAKSDRAKNDAVYHVWRPDSGSEGGGSWRKEYSKDLLVGDLVRVEENHRIPADVVLVASGMAKGTHCFVDTKDLDGETNLKPKFVPTVALKYLVPEESGSSGDDAPSRNGNGGGGGVPSEANDDDEDSNGSDASEAMLRRLERMEGVLECEQPNGNMSEFHATLHVQPQPGSGSAGRSKALVQNLALDSLILSECVLRSTPWVVGLVTYVGDESKLRSNMKKQLRQVRYKQTRVMRLTNRLFVFMALAQLVLCLAAAIACAVMQSDVQETAFYLQFRDTAAQAGVLQFFTWVILCKDFVPISLYVSAELVQFWQALFMGIDKSMSVQQSKVRDVDDDEEGEEQDELEREGDGVEVVEERSPLNNQKKDSGFDAPAHAAPTSPPSASSQPHAGAGSGDKDADAAGADGGAAVPSKRPRLVHETVYAKAQTSRLNEELSQVSYIFSDKTGTLTQNSMIFKKCVIGGRRYGQTSTQAGVIRRAKMEGKDVGAALAEFEAEREKQERLREKEGRAKFPHVEFDQAEEVLKAMHGQAETAEKKGQSDASKPSPASTDAGSDRVSAASSSSSSASSKPLSHADEVRQFLRALALNNAVFPKVDALRSGAPDPAPGASRSGRKRPSGSSAKSAPRYDLSNPATRAVMTLGSSSPDETALCYFAQFLGVELFSRAGGRTRLRVREGAPAAVLASTAAAAAQQQQQEEENTPKPSDSSSADAPARFEDYLDVCMLDFSAKRKRMTVLVEPVDPDTGKPSGRILVYCKGADSFVYPLLAGAQSNGSGAASSSSSAVGNGDRRSSSSAATGSAEEPSEPSDGATSGGGPANWDATYEHLVEFGGESLRTLVVAAGERDHAWWFGSDDSGEGGLKAEYERTQRNQGESEKGHVAGSCSSQCAMCAIETRIEREAGLRVVGATAIEDLLQEGVGVALKRLLDARIRVWMLTGDNVSTATNIAISCNLLEADMEREGRLFKLDRDDASSLENLASIIQQAQDTIAHMRQQDPDTDFGLALHSDAWKMMYDAEDEQPTAAAANGDKQKQQGGDKAASHAHAHTRTPEEVALQQSTLSAFFALTGICRSVIASRLEPREKAAIVEEMQKRTGLVCLAIGDGNNDEQMIRAADIGVGIRGVEGTSAVASSDYALCQFAHLTRLLLSYGHLHYRRMALLIHFIFYKSSTLVWTALFFGSMSMFSAQSLYLDWTFQLFNIAYTAYGILIVAVLDWDLSMDTLEAHPLIYSATRGATYFSAASIARWLFAGLVDSALCFWITWMAFAVWPAAHSSHDQDVGFAAMGLVVYTCVCMVVNLKLALFVRSWTWLHGLAVGLSVVIYWCATLIFDASSFFAIGGLDYHGVLSFVGAQPRFWLVLLLCLTASGGLTLVYFSIYELFWPRSPVQIYYEAAQLGIDMTKLDEQYAQVVARQELESSGRDRGESSGGTVKERLAAGTPRGLAESDEEAQRPGRDAASHRAAPAALSLRSPHGGATPAFNHHHPSATSPSAIPFSPVPLLAETPLGAAHPTSNQLHGVGAEPSAPVTGYGRGALETQASAGEVGMVPPASSRADVEQSQGSLSPSAAAFRITAPSMSNADVASRDTPRGGLARPRSASLASLTQPLLHGTNNHVTGVDTTTSAPPLALHIAELTPSSRHRAYSGFAFSHTPMGRLRSLQGTPRAQPQHASSPGHGVRSHLTAEVDPPAALSTSAPSSLSVLTQEREPTFTEP